MWFYDFVWFILSIIIRVFFRSVTKHGQDNIPKEGAVIFAGNHTNGMIDPAMLIVTCSRRLHFMAKSGLFTGCCGCTGLVLRGAGAIPVYRRQDGGGDNSSAFRAVDAVLSQGECFAIFPEGISHSLPEVQELKTGIARMALDFRKSHPTVPLSIVPCGLNYQKTSRFRSHVCVRYGVGIPVVDDNDVTSLMERITGALHSVTVNAEDWETVDIIHMTAKLYQPRTERHNMSFGVTMQLSSRISAVYENIRTDPATISLRFLMQHYIDRLRALGITDDVIMSESKKLSVIDFLVRFGFYFLCVLVLIPLSLPFMILNLPIFIPARYLGNRLAKKGGTDVIATFKVLIAFVLTPIVHITYIGVGVWWLSRNTQLQYDVWLPCIVLGLPFGSFSALLLFEMEKDYSRALFDLGVLWNHENEVAVMRVLRDDLTEYVRAFIEKYASDEEKRVLCSVVPVSKFRTAMTPERAETLLGQLATMTQNTPLSPRTNQRIIQSEHLRFEPKNNYDGMVREKSLTSSINVKEILEREKSNPTVMSPPPKAEGSEARYQTI